MWIIKACSVLAAVCTVAADSAGPTIDFSSNTGEPQHLAAGILYGIPDDVNQIPDDLLSGFGFNYYRGAGAQVSHGWSYDEAGFQERFESAHNNYIVTRRHNGGFVLLLNDLWGFDCSSNNNTSPGPGDNGDWSSYDKFVQAIIANVKKYNMQEGLVIDIWNEPEGSCFWGRSIDQWLQMWGRGWHQFNDAFGDSVLTSGPTLAGEPGTNDDWWTQWAQFVKNNDSIPDQYTWHEEGGSGSDFENSYNVLQQILTTYGLPQRQININEYATYNEQVPAGSAFWISQFERHNTIGLRGNWLSGTELHDLAASLLSKPDPSDYASTGYFPNGDWWVYNYYSHNMTGQRVSTSVSPDGRLDAYATVDATERTARVLLGCHPPTTGTYEVKFSGLTELGLPDGTLQVRTWKFAVGSDEHYSEMGPPQDLGYYGHTISNGEVTLPWFQTDDVTTYAWEFKF
ncbi:hypothetical protein FNYG_12403 [Fusarium nygamai]|uniref:Beta-xylosidase C-terminal Concanavalin A-like domain-containing protein n=1 Tax=Gibberella nygamai TaxID=42673 RepID=A0A2K0VWF1_GIBNY|nr:hypothetical protein FNYG_12403 [Fusarium nygamai]